MASGMSASPTLLPAFNQTTSTPSSPSTSNSPRSFPHDSPPSSPSSSSVSNFFTRVRSNSLHSLHSATLSRSRFEDAPPVPSLPAGLTASPNSSPSSSFRLATDADGTHPHIKSVTVPHHAKAFGKWVFACRVVPEGRGGTSPAAVAMARAGSLGRMEIAGAGEGGASEPHTVWRSWGEFVDFSARLSAAFPIVSPSASGASDLPSSFYRQTPRLTRKLTLFVTRSVLLARQDDLDLFSRRLFEMPDIVKRSSTVRDFFQMREHDLGSAAPTHSAPTSPNDDSESFARFLSEASSPNATVRAATGKPRTRPALAAKHSAPNLRKLMVGGSDTESASMIDVPFHSRARRPLLAEHRTHTLDENNLRNSNYSVSTASSASSQATITPAASASMSRLPSPLASRSPLPPLFFEAAEPASAPLDTAVPVAKARHQGLLRHFYSLQDIRGQNNASHEPSPPLPPFRSTDMARARTQPASAPPALGMTRPTPTRRERSDSQSSSTSSFGDCVPGSYSSSNGGWANGFRQGPTGRLDRVPESAQRPRRPSAARSYSNAKATLGHSPSPSASSIASTVSSRSASDMSRSTSSPGGFYPSRRSSTDYSDSMPGTPPNPQFEGEARGSGKYFVAGNGMLAQNNKVPLPPFFPVPPSMASVAMQAAYSQDGMAHSPRLPHRRGSSTDTRSRATSSASSRPSIDFGSPLSSSMSSFASGANVRPQDRPTITFKVLHADSNFVLRVPRTIKLDELRCTIENNFASSCSIKLGGDAREGQWALSYAPSGRSSGDVTASSELVVTEDDFQLALKRTEHLEKVALRIVS